jgi:hypothetical protein
MNKRAVVLVFALLVMLVLSALLTSFYFKTLSENQAARRAVDSTRAFWLAEAGVAQVKGSAGLSDKSGYVGSTDYTYSAAVTPVSGTYYEVVSVGTVARAGGNVSRTVVATIRTGNVDPLKFKYGIETTTDLVVKGSVDDSWKEYSTLDFADLFTVSKAVMKANATNLYTTSTFTSPADGITWVDVPTGETLTIAGELIGTGILVINGNAHFSGTVDFHGIIYVIGELTMTGDVETFGSILAESSTTVDTELKGNVTINYSLSDITDALNLVSFLSKEIVAWREN